MSVVLLLAGCTTLEVEVSTPSPATSHRSEPEPEPEPETIEPEPAPIAAAPEPVLDPSRVWIATDALETAKIATAPPRATWPAKVKSQRVQGWRFAKTDGSHWGPHDASAGLFASHKGARRFSTGRHPIQTANTGSCFRAEWPSTLEDTGVDPSDVEPLMIPEPHARHRGGWSGKVGWVQGARWVEAAGDGSWIRLEFREGWAQSRPPRFGNFGEPYEVRFPRVGEVESRGERFSVFAIRSDDQLHLLTVPLDEEGKLVTKSPQWSTDPARTSLPCASQRLVVETTARHQWLRSATQDGRTWRVSASPEERDGAPGVELRLVHEYSN